VTILAVTDSSRRLNTPRQLSTAALNVKYDITLPGDNSVSVNNVTSAMAAPTNTLTTLVNAELANRAITVAVTVDESTSAVVTTTAGPTTTAVPTTTGKTANGTTKAAAGTTGTTKASTTAASTAYTTSVTVDVSSCAVAKNISNNGEKAFTNALNKSMPPSVKVTSVTLSTVNCRRRLKDDSRRLASNPGVNAAIGYTSPTAFTIGSNENQKFSDELKKELEAANLPSAVTVNAFTTPVKAAPPISGCTTISRAQAGFISLAMLFVSISWW
jgi:hypothetical protein